MSDRILIVSARGGKVWQTTKGEMSLDAQKIIELANRATYTRRHFRSLMGKGITQNRASQKYGIPTRTISRWAISGHITRLGVPDDDPTAVLVDEADVAYCAACYHTMGTRPGQKLFNADGSLYIPKALGAELLPA